MTSYSVKTEVFEGPFDLLLHLVSRQKLDINAISLTRITDEYLEHIEQMRELDLDVASEFLLLAATLLDIKAHALLPEEEPYTGDDLDDLSPEEMRGLLIERLVTYKQYKNVAGELAQRLDSEGRMHPRQAGLESAYLGLMPDFLEGVTLRGLAVICAALEFKRDVFLLEAKHIAPTPLSLEHRAETIRARLHKKKRCSFYDLVGENPAPQEVVVTLLALLELYKRGICSLKQSDVFGDIAVERLDDDQSKMLGIEEDLHEYR